MKGRGTILALLGIWLIIAAIWRFVPVLEAWSDLMAGIVTAILGFSLVGLRPGNGWVAGLAGLWVIVAAFIPELHAGSAILINNIITGLVMMVAGFTIPQLPVEEEPAAKAA
ncbi:MAG TPA: hypothetical protein VGK48_00455 [Terriglobia bacterium]|jgi:hypothetical protein